MDELMMELVGSKTQEHAFRGSPWWAPFVEVDRTMPGGDLW